MSDVERELVARQRELGDGFTVRRVLPAPTHHMVGPFIFVDHMGPVQLQTGHGLDVRPHPHINLATITWLFQGEIVHRDCLGSEVAIAPGAVNWMTAGRGITHSERSSAAARKSGAFIHGAQLWVALPNEHEEIAPSFEHHPAANIPLIERPGARLRLIAGAAYDATSPVKILSPLFYVDAQLEAGATLALPSDQPERAAYIVSGAVQVADKIYREGSMIVFREGSQPTLTARDASHLLLIGGAPVGERHIFWNFVSSRPGRIEAAKRDWTARRFASIPGDDAEFIPLPTT